MHDELSHNSYAGKLINEDGIRQQNLSSKFFWKLQVIEESTMAVSEDVERTRKRVRKRGKMGEGKFGRSCMQAILWI